MAPRPETERSEIAGLKVPSFSEGREPEAAPKVLVPPDGGWGWMVLLGTMIMNIVVIGHGKSFGVYFKKLMQEFDASPSRVAWLLSLQISMFSFLCKSFLVCFISILK